MSSGRKSKSPGLKSPPATGSRTKLQHHTASWVIHNPYKLTHASIIHKYSRIMQRQRNSKTSKLNRFLTKRTSFQTPHKMSKSKNKVWRASDHCGGGSTTRTSIGRSAPLRRLSGGHELKTRHGNRQWVARRAAGPTPGKSGARYAGPVPWRRLSGHELKTRQGNRQWVSRRAAGSFPPTPGKSGARYAGPVPWRRLSGHELKTRQGNRQWVSRRVVMRRKTLQSPAANGRGRWMTAHYEGRRGKSLQFVSMSGQKFVVDSGGRRMKRLSLSSPSSPRLRLRSRGRSVSESHTPSHSIKQYLASRAVQRSRVYVWSAKHRKKDNAKRYCIFYNRFGKCNRGDSCPYIHDPSKIAVCTKFLRGMCDKTDGSCLFSHTLSKDKLPTCRYFLRGVCTREVCPYRHVSVGRRAEVCLNFARGYCPNGEQCSKRHIVDCPEFSEQGSCPHGDKCLLRHRKKTEAPPTKTKTLPTKTPLAFRRLRRDRVGPQPPEYVELDPAISPLDDTNNGGEGSGGDASDADYLTLCQDARRLSPLDPSCPAPDFLAL
ncbi:Zinc finger CCCH domain-containing protein 3 [Geodia barretti]|nr:Zinc finger CCCH domain-containing protein 3 [Geodia barretti]